MSISGEVYEIIGDILEVLDISSSGTNDAGDLFDFECPKCHQEITLTSGSAWWPTSCGCGYKWDLTLKATGTKEKL